MTDKKFSLLKQRIGDIQYGLLRFRQKNKQVSLQVKVSVNEDSSLNCIVTDEYTQKLVNKNVHLIQKYRDDYLHIAGRVSNETGINKKILAFQIERACWFVRHSKGNVSWLQQKCLYETLEENKKNVAA